MSGEPAGRDLGQLALLDAMVFFAAAILLSSIVMSFSIDSSDSTAPGTARVDANEVLVSFLHASVSQRFEIELDEPLAVSGRETFALCLSLEAGVILDGGTVEPFQSMNEIIFDALLRLSPPGFSPCVIVTNETRGLNEPLFAVPGIMERSSEVYAGSTWIPTSTGDELLVVLMLAPASPAEIASV